MEYASLGSRTYSWPRFSHDFALFCLEKFKEHVKQYKNTTAYIRCRFWSRTSRKAGTKFNCCLFAQTVTSRQGDVFRYVSENVKRSMCFVIFVQNAENISVSSCRFTMQQPYGFLHFQPTWRNTYVFCILNESDNTHTHTHFSTFSEKIMKHKFRIFSEKLRVYAYVNVNVSYKNEKLKKRYPNIHSDAGITALCWKQHVTDVHVTHPRGSSSTL